MSDPEKMADRASMIIEAFVMKHCNLTMFNVKCRIKLKINSLVSYNPCLKPGFHIVLVGLCGSLRVAQFWERP